MAYHHGNLRHQLVERAVALIEEVGVDGFTLRRLARDVGVSHTAAYRHFVDKDALLAEIGRQGFEGLVHAFDAAVAASGSPSERFGAVGRAYVGYALEHPAHFRVMFRMLHVAEHHPDLAEASEGARQVLTHWIEASQAEGTVRAGDAEVLALAAWSLVHGLATLLLDRAAEVPDREQAARACTELLRDGLAPR